jgi:hypothetical protein
MMTLEVLNITGLRTKEGKDGGGIARSGASCPQPGQLANFVLGLAEEEEADAMSSHLRNCQRCRILVNAVSEAIETLD